MSTPRHVNPWLVAVAVMFATFMEVLDTTVVNVSLPHIAGNLSASIEEATWAITSYLVANAIILPMAGWLASVFGRKRLLLWATTGRMPVSSTRRRKASISADGSGRARHWPADFVKICSASHRAAAARSTARGSPPAMDM